MRIHLKAVDSLTLIFTGLLSALTLLFLNSIPRAGWLLSRYGMVLVVVTGLAIYATQPRAGKALLTFRDFFPVLVILILFDSLGDLLPWVRPRVFDEGLIGIDHALFGVHPTVWMERFIHPLLTAVLQVAYSSYYPRAVVLGVTLAVRKKGKEFDTAVALMTLYYAWKTKEKVLAGVLLPVVSALIVSTVYLRYHYVIDVLAGIALAGLTAWAAPGTMRLLSRAAGQVRDHQHHAP